MSTDTTREALAWDLLVPRWGGEESRGHLEHMVREYGPTYEPWLAALRDADAVLASDWLTAHVAAAVTEKDAEIAEGERELEKTLALMEAALDQRDEARADAESLRAVALDERATTIRVAEQRDIRANQIEEALSVLEMVKDRVDDFTYDEFSHVLDDGPLDDEHGRIIPSPLRRERDEARAALDAIRALVDEWEANGNSRDLGDPSADVWHKAARQLLTALSPSAATAHDADVAAAAGERIAQAIEDEARSWTHGYEEKVFVDAAIIARQGGLS